MEKKDFTDKVTDAVASAIIDLIDYGAGMARSCLATAVAGVAAFFVYKWAAPAVFPVINFWQAMALVLVGRIVVGPPIVHYHAPLDTEEREMIRRMEVVDAIESGEPYLQAVSEDDDGA